MSGLALAGIILAWLLGNWRNETQYLDSLKKILPDQYHIEQKSAFIFSATEKKQNTLYMGLGYAKAYEGPIACVLITDSLSRIIDLRIISHSETPSYFNKVIRAKFTEFYMNKSILEILQSENKPDAISGATYTSLGIKNSVAEAVSSLAKEVFDIPLPPKVKTTFQISFLDVLILVFFVAVILGRKLKAKTKQWVRYIMISISVVTLGFSYNFHLSISRFNSLILGYWPDIHFHLAWYILVFGVILLTVINGKNPYCHWFCPFGAVQEGIGKIGRARFTLSRKYRNVFIWIPRVLAWLAVVIVLIYKNPGLTSYEVFGKFFTLTGSDLLFVLTLISLVFSLIIKQPWCSYLCPVPPVIDYIIYVRKQMIGLWQQKK